MYNLLLNVLKINESLHSHEYMFAEILHDLDDEF